MISNSDSIVDNCFKIFPSEDLFKGIYRRDTFYRTCYIQAISDDTQKISILFHHYITDQMDPHGVFTLFNHSCSMTGKYFFDNRFRMNPNQFKPESVNINYNSIECTDMNWLWKPDWNLTNQKAALLQQFPFKKSTEPTEKSEIPKILSEHNTRILKVFETATPPIQAILNSVFKKHLHRVVYEAIHNLIEGNPIPLFKTCGIKVTYKGDVWRITAFRWSTSSRDWPVTIRADFDGSTYVYHFNHKEDNTIACRGSVPGKYLLNLTSDYFNSNCIFMNILTDGVRVKSPPPVSQLIPDTDETLSSDSSGLSVDIIPSVTPPPKNEKHSYSPLFITAVVVSALACVFLAYKTLQYGINYFKERSSLLKPLVIKFREIDKDPTIII